jgi:hypothetical protein
VQQFIKYYRLLNLLSIDVALGAVSCTAWFAFQFDFPVSTVIYFLLGFSVWIVYTVDHLMDANLLQIPAATYRHAFHQQHRFVLWVMVIFMITVNIVLMLFIPIEVILNGTVLTGVVLIYLLTNKKFGVIKELVIAVVYTCGVMAPLFSFAVVESFASSGLVMLSFFLVVLTNLILFSWYDYDLDKGENTKSFAGAVGHNNTVRILVVLFLLQCIISAISQSILFLLMELVMVPLFVWPTLFSKNERFRLVGDAIFLLPGISIACKVLANIVL